MDKITILNIDDYIRQQKRDGLREITWSKGAFDILKQFSSKLTGNGEEYLGAKHYLCK